MFERWPKYWALAGGVRQADTLGGLVAPDQEARRDTGGLEAVDQRLVLLPDFPCWKGLAWAAAAVHEA
jgi:hypothetical protein